MHSHSLTRALAALAPPLVGAAIASTLAGCYVITPVPAYAVAVDDGGTDLVEISPGIEVVPDVGEPIFFADDYYWAYRGGLWYSSTWYGGGWVRTGPPRWSVRVPHPEAYVHYRPAGWAPHPPVHGGYDAHTRYHVSHPPPGGVRARPAVHGGHGRR